MSSFFFLNIPFRSLLINALSLSFSLSDWQLNIDGLEIAEEPQMLSVLRRGQVWPTNSNEQRIVNTR